MSSYPDVSYWRNGHQMRTLFAANQSGRYPHGKTGNPRTICGMLTIMIRIALTLGLISAAAGMASAGRPKQAPAQFSDWEYELTFRVPDGATYCPLSNDWVGSDHGTIVFLEPPKMCGGAGYPSNARYFEPGTAARLQLYYGYWTGEEAQTEPPCHQVGETAFLGKSQPICESRKDGLIMLAVGSRYTASLESEAHLSLVTNSRRLTRDTATFRAVAASFRVCTASGSDPRQSGRNTKAARIPPCPKDSKWF